MKPLVFVISFVLLSVAGFSQPPSPEGQPPRTPEEIAQKQTARLTRELNLTDSVQCDTLYRMHLKYVLERRANNTRGAEFERMQRMNNELKGILTAEQYERFMNRPMDDHPRRPQPVYSNEAQYKRQAPPEPRQ